MNAASRRVLFECGKTISFWPRVSFAECLVLRRALLHRVDSLERRGKGCVCRLDKLSSLENATSLAICPLLVGAAANLSAVCLLSRLPPPQRFPSIWNTAAAAVLRFLTAKLSFHSIPKAPSYLLVARLPPTHVLRKNLILTKPIYSSALYLSTSSAL